MEDEEELNRSVIESAVMRALVPGDATRRRFLRAVGASTAYAAVASVFPFGALEAMAQEKKQQEKARKRRTVAQARLSHRASATAMN